MRVPSRGTLFDTIKRLGVDLFVGWVLKDEAHRSGLRGHRQELPMQGRNLSLQGKITNLRTTDRSERAYVCVRSLELAGEINYEACRSVTALIESKLGNSQRGRPRETKCNPDFLDKVGTVRSLYNAFKRRHPFKERLPLEDFCLEKWWWNFINALATGAMNMGFAAQLDPRESEARDNVRDLGPAKSFQMTLEISAEEVKTAGGTRPAEVLLLWSDCGFGMIPAVICLSWSLPPLGRATFPIRVPQFG